MSTFPRRYTNEDKELPFENVSIYSVCNYYIECVSLRTEFFFSVNVIQSTDIGLRGSVTLPPNWTLTVLETGLSQTSHHLMGFTRALNWAPIKPPYFF